MNDVILFLIVFIIGYICSMAIVLLLGKLYFPFLTERELAKKQQLAHSK